MSREKICVCPLSALSDYAIRQHGIVLASFVEVFGITAKDVKI